MELARFPEQFIQQVIDATDVVELISNYVALKKRGKEFVGLCPFHDDKRPSLTVSPTKQIFKCFSCGAGGKAHHFLMLHEKLTFPEALRALAERANIPLPRQADAGGAQAGVSRNDLLKVVAFAGRFYHGRLHAPAGQAALQYARGRGLTDESIERFGLGCAPGEWEGLARSAGAEGYSRAQLVAAGLAVRREDGSCYDRFRDRLIFPIYDPAGQMIAFGGRAMQAGEKAKYLNSAESILFDKSSQLYALNWSRRGIVSSKQAIVVEGYLDALIPLQAGVGNVVATLGTALGERHVRVLSRYAQEAVLVFDADQAGIAAAERALEVFLAQQVHVRVATIPAGKDPCDYCLSEGGEALQRLVAGAPDALQYVWSRRQEAYRAAGNDLAARRRIVEDFLRLIVSSTAYGAIDEVRRGQLVQHVAHMLDIRAEDLRRTMRGLARRTRRGPSGDPAGPVEEQPDAGVRAERQLLEVVLNRPDLFETAAGQVQPEDFSEASLREVAQRVWQISGRGRLSTEQLLASEDDVHQAALVTSLAAAGQRRENYEETLNAAVEYMRYRRSRREIQSLKSGDDSDETLRKLSDHFARADPRRRPRIS